MADDRAGHGRSESHGAVAWMARNRITPNLMMLVFLAGGLFVALRIKQEVFPEFDLNMVMVRVAYPGSSPEEVEQGIILVIEEAIRGLDGIKEITATAAEGMGMVNAELEEGADNQKTYQDIKQEIDRIITFPLDAEEPEVSMVIRRREVLDVLLYGDADEWVLRELAEQVRDRLLQDPLITQVDLAGARRYEVAIEIDQHVLRAYGLTLTEVAQRVRQTSVEIPGGNLETQGGDILLRVSERRDWAKEFMTIPLITTADGSVLFLGDVAQIKDTFEEQDRYATYNGQRAMGIEVFRVGDQTPIGISDAAREAMSEIEADLPPGINWVINRDRSDIYRQRLELLLKNAFLGLTLVIILLGMFLEFRLAFWVTMGIPISFLGCFLFLPMFDVTINMISMFAFIVALGIVVDDAIVVGENIYEYRQRGASALQAAIQGARDVLLPVTFSILTNIVAFLPLCFMPGVMGRIWRAIPFVVITVFTISWVEALLILPCHLGHGRNKPGRTGLLGAIQHLFSRALDWIIRRLYMPFLDLCIRFRLVTVTTSLAVLIAVLGYVNSGRIGIVGAVMGHIIMGYALSLMSMMGIVALCGVVVNDSLVLIDYANRRRREGSSPSEAIHKAGVRRFRPILLTTMTTFGGLAPMIFETSRQARFMIPMAISLGFGIVFATAITLVIVPCLYLMAEDAGRTIRWLYSGDSQ